MQSLIGPPLLLANCYRARNDHGGSVLMQPIFLKLVYAIGFFLDDGQTWTSLGYIHQDGEVRRHARKEYRYDIEDEAGMACMHAWDLHQQQISMC